MLLDFPYTRITHRGKIYGSQSWSFSFYIADTSGTPPVVGALAVLGAPAGAFGTLVPAFYTGIKALASPQCTYDTQLYEAFNVAGTKVDEFVGSQSAIGSGGALGPAQIALVVSLRTGGFGRSARGRVYLPANALACTANGNATAAACLNTANAVSAYLGGMHSGPDQPSVASHKTGHLEKITKVIVDSVPDTQRRRRDKIVSVAGSTVAVP